MKIVFLILILLPVSVAFGQQEIQTRDAQSFGKGIMQIGVGAEFLSKKRAPFTGAPKSLWRVPAINMSYGVAENVDLEFDWSGRLIASLDGNAQGSDWADPVIGTVVTVFSEDENHPALGLRTAVKLPSTSFLPYFLGSDQTDFYFSILTSKHFSSVETRINVGLGIIGNPRELGSQDDIYILSGAVLFPIFEDEKIFLEGFGFTGYKDDDDKLLLRSGIITGIGSLQWSLYGSVRVAGNNKDFGAAFSMSEDVGIGIKLMKQFSF